MTTTDRRDATDAQFADELARLDRLDVADESAVERVARALWADDVRVYGNTVAMPSWESGEPDLTDDFRRLARAAIAALKPAPATEAAGPTVQRDHSPGHCVSVEDANRVLAETRGSTEDALHRVLDLADEYGTRGPESNGWLFVAAEGIRAAVAGPQRGHDKEGGQ